MTVNPKKILIPLMLAVAMLLVTPLATAHPWVVGTGSVLGEDTIYFHQEENALFEESNGKTDQGAQSYGPLAGDTGLQMHDVCFGIHTEEEIDQWNHDMSHGHYGPGQRYLNYIPWEDGAAACVDAGGEFVVADTLILAL
jgi:hypothetical protein